MSSSCVTSLSFSVFFFFLSLCLSLGLIRPAVEPGPPGKGSRVWLELRPNWGGWRRRRGCKLRGGPELPTIFPMQHSTQSGVLASSRLFSPLHLLSFHPSINFLSILLFLLTTPASVSFPPPTPPRLPRMISSVRPLFFLPFPILLPVVLLSMVAAVES